MSYDAIIIGSGLGGATMALKLAQSGRKVLILERGEDFKPDMSKPDNEFLYSRVEPKEDLFFTGGRSKFYGAALYRFREIDFKRVEFENGVSPEWPFDYAELEPYYAEGEKLFKVHGSPEGDPSEPWRTEPFPYPPLPNDPIVDKMADRFKKQGASMSAIPLGVDYNEDGACTLCAKCDAFHCRRDAKMDADTAVLRPALATGNVEIRKGAECKRVLLDESGQKAVGVIVLQNGVTETLHAPLICVSAGAPHSALLLRQSRNNAHPEGIGNHSGQLGRQVGGHSTGALFPIVTATPMGDRHVKTMGVNAFYEGAADWDYPLGVMQISGQMPFWLGAHPLKQLVFKEVAYRTLTVFHMTEAVPSQDTGWIFNGDELGEFIPPHHQSKTYRELRKRIGKLFGKAGYQVLKPSRPVEYWHLTGGAVMGNDPATSVVDANCQVHGVEGLYVVDASNPPSAAAVNTGLTIIAIALRTAAKITQTAPAGAAQLA